MRQPAHPPALDDSPTAMLYQRYAAPIFVYLRMHTSAWEDAEDLLLEVFLAALEQSDLLALPEEKQVAWLRSVAQHKLVDHYRRTVRRPAVPLEQVAEALQEDEERSPEQIALRQEEHHRLAEAIKRLPAAQQEVLRLRFTDGLRTRQIAALLGKREETVQKILYRIITRLRTIYFQYPQSGSS